MELSDRNEAIVNRDKMNIYIFGSPINFHSATKDTSFQCKIATVNWIKQHIQNDNEMKKKKRATVKELVNQ